MNIALVGSSSYIAGFLLRQLEKQTYIDNVVKIGKSFYTDMYLDLQKAEEFNYSSLKNIDFIIFLAAISEPDKCASDFEYCWNINVRGTEYFIKNALAYHCKVLFFSSDAVFGNIEGCIYTEESETMPVTPYGKMKKAIEDKFRDHPNFKTIRLSYVVSVKDRFVAYCLSCIEKNEVAEVYHPFYRNCISVSDVVNVVKWFLQYFPLYKPFVLNVSGKELISRVRIADELNRCLGYSLKYVVSMPEESFFKNRPQITQMKSLYMKEYEILEDNTFTEKIQKEIGDII